jgi:hypothetical protein
MGEPPRIKRGATASRQVQRQREAWAQWRLAAARATRATPQCRHAQHHLAYVVAAVARIGAWGVACTWWM